MCVLTTCVMFPISHKSILSVRFGPTWVNSVSDEECDNKCDKCPYKQHICHRPRPQQRPTVLVSLLRSVVCFHEKNAEKTWKRREKDHPSPEQSWKSLIHYKKPSSHSLELQIWCIYTGCTLYSVLHLLCSVQCMYTGCTVYSAFKLVIQCTVCTLIVKCTVHAQCL